MSTSRLVLAAADAEDLETISARLQDAVAQVKDLVYLPKSRRFAGLFNRFKWESAGRHSGTRVRAGLHIEGVLSAKAYKLRAANPEARFIPNGPPDFKSAGDLAAIQFADFQASRGLTPPWANGRRAKEYRSVMGRRPIGGIFSVGVEEPYRWKDSVQSEPEIRLWVAEGTANGMRPWVTKFSGVLYDRRWLPMVERIYDWHYRHERYLRTTVFGLLSSSPNYCLLMVAANNGLIGMSKEHLGIAL